MDPDDILHAMQTHAGLLDDVPEHERQATEADRALFEFVGQFVELDRHLRLGGALPAAWAARKPTHPALTPSMVRMLVNVRDNASTSDAVVGSCGEGGAAMTRGALVRRGLIAFGRVDDVTGRGEWALTATGRAALERA